MDTSIFFSMEQTGNVLVVSLLRSVGSFAEEEARGEWGQLVEQAMASDVTAVLLDFRSLSYFGSTMLEWMVSLWRRMRDKGGQLAICNVSEVGREILYTAKFDKLWSIFPSREEALAALKA